MTPLSWMRCRRLGRARGGSRGGSGGVGFAVVVGVGVFESWDVGRLTAIALIGFLPLRCHYQEVHSTDHGYPVDVVLKWKGLLGN
jgi:hypothetical protein